MSGGSNETGGLAWRPVSGGLALSVRLTPKSSRDAIDGVQILSDGRTVLAARVRAVPDKGKANAALTKLLAGWLAIPAANLKILSEQTSRLKSIRIEGDARQLAESLQSRIKNL